MGWGISIDQDVNGHVYCNDANFETTEDDYEGYPPSSYEFICKYMDRYHHSEIDMARDEGSAELAHEYCRDAFNSAQSAYDHLDAKKQQQMHDVWVKKTRDEIEGCVVDTEAETLTLKDIEEYKKEYSQKIEDLEKKLKDLEQELYSLKAPLTMLQIKLGDIQRPASTKARLEEFLEKEMEIFTVDGEDDEDEYEAEEEDEEENENE